MEHLYNIIGDFLQDYHNFSIKSYVVAIYKIRLGEAILIDRTTYDFMEKLPFFHFISIPDLPRFYYMFNRLHHENKFV